MGRDGLQTTSLDDVGALEQSPSMGFPWKPMTGSKVRPPAVQSVKMLKEFSMFFVRVKSAIYLIAICTDGTIKLTLAAS